MSSKNCTRSATSTNHTRQSDRTVLAQPRLQTTHFNQTELYSLSHVYKPHTSIRQNCTRSATSTNQTLQSDRTVLAQPRLQTTHFNQTELYSLSHVYKPHTRNQTELYSLSHVYKPHTSIRQNCTRSATSTNHTLQSESVPW